MEKLRSIVVAHPVAAFFVLTYALSWALWIPAVIVGLGTSDVASLLIGIGAFGPPAAALAMAAVLEGRAGVAGLLGGLTRWRVGARWYAVALFGTLAINAIAFLVAIVNGQKPVAGWSPPLGSFLAGFATVFLIGGGQEELGWRGFALPRLQQRLGAFPAALVIGIAWAGWHIPAFAMPAFTAGVPPFAFFAPWVVAEAVLIAWLFNKTGGSVLLAMIWHAAMNNAAALLPVDAGAVAGDPRLQVVLLGVTWLAALLVVGVFGAHNLWRATSIGRLPATRS